MTIEGKSKLIMFPKLGKLPMLIFGSLLVICGIKAFELYGFIFKPNVTQDSVIYIPTGSSLDQVENTLIEQKVFSNMKAFRWVANKKEYKDSIKPGRYELKKGWNTNEAINKLRSGNQDPVKLTFSNVRLFSELAGKISHYIEADSVSLYQKFTDSDIQKKYKFDKASFSAMFIPNTYEFYWTTSADQFLEKMHQEYNHFWNNERIEKAKKLGFSAVEVTTLASIVQEETAKEEEKPAIAALYLNRLKMGMILQADPTIKYALQDFGIRRISNDMLQTDSPYNTYRYAGLPPGPINFPETSSIEAVLNPKQHNYIYMCAKDDFSGFHNFATNLTDHNRNAARYQKALNQKKIWK
jgi:UPF0755 protein